MKETSSKRTLALALILGSVWGLSEVALGVGLRACAHLFSGSLMTGVALFFIASGWRISKNLLIPVFVVVIAALFKMLDAVLLSLPLQHGAIGNPIFAFLLEGFAFILLVSLFRKASWKKRSSQALLGGGAALIAVGMFPLVRFATGIPACVYPNTAIPLSVLFAPVAVLFSAVTVPLAFQFAEKISLADGALIKLGSLKIKPYFSPAAFVVCLVLVILFRVVVH